ncbi:MAG: glycoside hydrolase family 9 protein [Cyclobacteriaceae bacterium]|nr:glycoside hydrolase family 9 protein [Cyclobacteriaceae bacterium]
MKNPLSLLLCITLYTLPAFSQLKINDKEYFEMQGLNVMVFQDIYPEGHQGGLGIIQNGVRVATNGDIRLEHIPGQWAPIPKQGERIVDKDNNEIRVTLTYPDSSKHLVGFNPLVYPDLYFNYTVTVKAEGNAIRISVDLDRPLPEAFIGQAGFNFELYPVDLFGKSFLMDGQPGQFPRQANGPVTKDHKGEVQPIPYASGKMLTIAPESDAQRMVIESLGSELLLFDGRTNHNNGWFVIRSLIPSGATKNAIEWIIRPHAIPGWIQNPVVQISQVGYHPRQSKIAHVETDPNDPKRPEMFLYKLDPSGRHKVVKYAKPREWGDFLRFKYFQFDFSEIVEEGTYMLEYGDIKTHAFLISEEVFDRHVWQPTLEYFLPVQMCHMRVNEKYKVWHDLCHQDDALMAPTDLNHFDGYVQGSSTLTKYKPGEHVHGLNVGGWHDAGDDDLRIESQAGEVYIMSLAWEAFKVTHDNTYISQEEKHVEIHQPDGKPDLLQQIEHGLISIIGGYKSLGRLYRGIISPTLEQYVMAGDVAAQTDNLIYDAGLRKGERTATHSWKPDDRWVFTEENPAREFSAIAYIAAGHRALKGFNDELARETITVAEELWKVERTLNPRALHAKIHAAIELYISTGKNEYRQFILNHQKEIVDNISSLGWVIGRVMPSLSNNRRFTIAVRNAVAQHAKKIAEEQKETPYGVPYRPHIWGAGWGIQKFGVDQYFFHTGFPDLVDKSYMINALNFVLGAHPGVNTASFASGVGAHSMTVAYGYNRMDYSFIPGGVVSGTALIRPDFPELKMFPYLWQQSEYVMGGGASNFMFLVLAAQQLLKE